MEMDAKNITTRTKIAEHPRGAPAENLRLRTIL